MGLIGELQGEPLEPLCLFAGLAVTNSLRRIKCPPLPPFLPPAPATLLDWLCCSSLNESGERGEHCLCCFWQTCDKKPRVTTLQWSGNTYGRRLPVFSPLRTLLLFSLIDSQFLKIHDHQGNILTYSPSLLLLIKHIQQQVQRLKGSTDAYH